MLLLCTSPRRAYTCQAHAGIHCERWWCQSGVKTLSRHYHKRPSFYIFALSKAKTKSRRGDLRTPGLLITSVRSAVAERCTSLQIPYI